MGDRIVIVVVVLGVAVFLGCVYSLGAINERLRCTESHAR